MLIYIYVSLLFVSRPLDTEYGNLHLHVSDGAGQRVTVPGGTTDVLPQVHWSRTRTH